MEGQGEVPPAAAANPQARHLTVLKCDIVGSTRVKKALDLEGQLEFRQQWEALVSASVATRDGHVEAFEGDGALVLFGYPEAREDAAERAVHAALDIAEAVRRARLVPGVQLEVRVGVATGTAAVLGQRPGAKSEPVAGITIDVAERLRSAAEPGCVVIDRTTRRLAGGFFGYHDLGRLVVKGFEEGVRAWRVESRSAVFSRFEAQRFDDSARSIVGRDGAVERLSRAWADARSGRGRALCLVGDAGMGKSRLARAALELATGGRDGAGVLEVDCTPSTGNSPLFPVGVSFRRLAGIGPDASTATTRALADRFLVDVVGGDRASEAFAYLAPLFGLGGEPLPPGTGPAEVRERTLSAVLDVVRSLAAKRPLVVLCEDLHWVDATTAKLVEALATGIGAFAMLLIATRRTTSDETPLDFGRFETIELDALAHGTAAELVRAVAGDRVLPDDVVRGIVERCEGVPLVLAEVTRATLEATGTAEQPGGGGPGSTVPTPLELVVQSRLARRPQLAPIAQAASVLGREFSTSLLAQLVPCAGAVSIDDAIGVLARDGLFAPPDPQGGRARFKHVMIREAVYNTLLGNERRRLHSRAADTLAECCRGTPDGAADVVADHLCSAARFAEAVGLRLAASRDTAARGAYVETEGHCDAALALVDRIADEAERRALEFKLLVQLGVACTGEHGYSAPQTERAYRRALALCDDSAEAGMLYPVIRGLATVNLVRADLSTAYELSLQGVKLAEQSQRPEFRIDALSVLAYATLYHGRLDDCRACLERCLALYDREQGHSLTYPVAQDAGTAAWALVPTVAWLLGDFRGAEEAIEHGLRHAEKLDRDFDRALLHAWIAGTRYTQRRYRLAEEHAGIAIALSERHGYREWYTTGRLMCLLAQAAREPSPQAVAEAAALCHEFARLGVGLNAPYYLAALARGHARLGDGDSARAMLAEAFRRAEASGETRMNAELLALQSTLEPDRDTALQLLARALAIADEQGTVATALSAAAQLVSRAQRDEADVALARETSAVLEGGADMPAKCGPRWMHERLARLREAIPERCAPNGGASRSAGSASPGARSSPE